MLTCEYPGQATVNRYCFGVGYNLDSDLLQEFPRNGCSILRGRVLPQCAEVRSCSLLLGADEFETSWRQQVHASADHLRKVRRGGKRVS